MTNLNDGLVLFQIVNALLANLVERNVALELRLGLVEETLRQTGEANSCLVEPFHLCLQVQISKQKLFNRDIRIC